MRTIEFLAHLHIGSSGGDHLSTWLLGATAGFVLAVAVNRMIRLNQSEDRR